MVVVVTLGDLAATTATVATVIMIAVAPTTGGQRHARDEKQNSSPHDRFAVHSRCHHIYSATSTEAVKMWFAPLPRKFVGGEVVESVTVGIR